MNLLHTDEITRIYGIKRVFKYIIIHFKIRAFSSMVRRRSTVAVGAYRDFQNQTSDS